ncbi:MAG: alpha-L-arabinofuranosidase [Lentisphaerae bacterium]|nr:alpha-L-arabinofuranosidase [Lentisphaerota bacterium]
MVNKAIVVDSEPRFGLSPDLYMQFMEPLGSTDGSVAAAWDHVRGDWRQDVVDVTAELAPPLMRFGGCFSSYYRWREGVGLRQRRRPMHNLLWGGMESNHVGTGEFVEFCRRVGSEPFFCVNFESDGRRHWARPPCGGVRSAGPAEAAAWVDYCNNPRNALRRRNGAAEPFNLKLWQVGNETSYDPLGYDCETAARRTIAFAKAMRRKDPEIKIIGWGDSGWAKRMLDIAGEHLDFLAFHNMFRAGSAEATSPLRNNSFRNDPDATWAHLMNAWREPQEKIERLRAETGDSSIPLALTECHFTLPGRNRCEVLSTWAAGVANARILNVHERNGDRIKIATLADFCGNRWQVNAIMIPTPHGRSFMMPVARVMSLYRRHSGTDAIRVVSAPSDLDVTASRSGNTLFLHVVNTCRTSPVPADIRLAAGAVRSARSFQIAAPPELEIMEHNADALAVQERMVPKDMKWTFPPASVSAIEIRI